MQETGITQSQKPVQPVAVIALGWALILLGIVGVVLPVVPGAVLIGVGVLIVNPQGTWLRRILEKCRVRVPVRPSSGASPLRATVTKASFGSIGPMLDRSSKVRWLVMDEGTFQRRGQR